MGLNPLWSRRDSPSTSRPSEFIALIDPAAVNTPADGGCLFYASALAFLYSVQLRVVLFLLLQMQTSIDLLPDSEKKEAPEREILCVGSF